MLTRYKRHKETGQPLDSVFTEIVDELLVRIFVFKFALTKREWAIMDEILHSRSQSVIGMVASLADHDMLIFLEAPSSIILPLVGDAVKKAFITRVRNGTWTERLPEGGEMWLMLDAAEKA